MTAQPAPDKLRRAGIRNRGGTQAIVAENRLAVGVVDRKKGLCAAHFVVLTGVAPQEFVQRRFAAVEGLPVMPFANRLLVPGRNVHFRFGSDFAAASSFAFGLGGFSSTAKTRRLSRSESSRCSSFWITAFAALKVYCRTEPV